MNYYKHTFCTVEVWLFIIKTLVNCLLGDGVLWGICYVCIFIYG